MAGAVTGVWTVSSFYRYSIKIPVSNRLCNPLHKEYVTKSRTKFRNNFFLSQIQKYIQKRKDTHLEFRKDINQGVESILSFGSFRANMYSRSTANTSLSLPPILLPLSSSSSTSSRLSACSLTHLFNIPSNVLLVVFAI